MVYDKLCNDILYIDPQIRFVGIFDAAGEFICGGPREGISILFTIEELRSSGIQALSRWMLFNPDRNKMGEAKFTIVEYEKVRVIALPFDNDFILFVTTEIESNYMNIINRILRLKGSLQKSYLVS